MFELLAELLLSAGPRGSRTRRAVLILVSGLLFVVAAVILCALYLGGPAWSVAIAIVLIALLGLLVRRVQPVEESEPAIGEMRTPSDEEVRVRAARERAERDLLVRGSHPLGHPGSGGRWSDDR
jgi:membrane protein implicated in regulation of membrane protease activity